MIIQGYSLDFFRNIKNFKYTSKLNIEEKNKIRDLILNSISRENLPLKFLPSYKAEKNEIDYIQEQNLLAMTYSEHSDPAVLYDNQGKLFFSINDMDHLLLSIQSDGDVYKSYEYGKKILDGMSETLDFQKDRTLGYLSPSIPLCGNGFVVDVLVHIPALMSLNRVIMSVNKAFKKTGALIIPFNNNALPNAFFIIRCVSKTEPETDIKFVKNLAEELEVMENSAVMELKENEDFILYLNERIKQNMLKQRVSFENYLRYLDDVILMKKIKDGDINSEHIRELLISTQPRHMIKNGILESEVDKFYYKTIFNDNEEGYSV